MLDEVGEPVTVTSTDAIPAVPEYAPLAVLVNAVLPDAALHVPW